jgi:SAM-dependent methyltransferase
VGLTPSNLRLLIRLGAELGFEGPVLSLGNQDVCASAADLRGYFDQMGHTPHEQARILAHTSAAFARHWPERARDFVHARTVFEMLGIDGYVDLDRFPDDAPQRLHDLNQPLPGDLEEAFGLVLDSGTLEHVFDVRQALENVVRAARVGGWVIHFSPAADVDHGFYSFSPTLFYDLYEANGFVDARCFIQLLDPEDLMAPCPTFEYRYGMALGHVLEPRRVPLVCFAARKTAPVEKLVIPIQGLYDSSRPWPSGEARAADRDLPDVEVL